MRTMDRARVVALALLAAVSGSASVGIAALARAGFCLHRLGFFGLHAAPSDAMPGMTMTAGPACPILIGVGAFGAVCYLVAIVALAALRPSLREFALTSARLVARVRLAPLALVLGVVGAVPVGACIVADGTPAPVGVGIAALFLIATALLVAALLAGAARAILAYAVRVVAAWLAVVRLLVADLAAALVPRPPALIPVRIRAARRRPSRAPPVRSRR